MTFKKRLCFAGVVLGILLVNSECSRAAFDDFDDEVAGTQTASWPEPSTIMIFIPNGLAGADRMNFEMGINAVANCLPRISVQFKNGEPPQNPQNSIDVNVVGTQELTPPPYGDSNPTAFFQENQNHGSIDGGTIRIAMSALGHSAVAASMMKNLGAHEFGHALGLAHDPAGQGQQRSSIMDPNFLFIDDGEGNITGATPFVAPSAMDKMMLREHYSVVPEPSTFALATLGLLWLGWRRRKRA